MERVETVVVGGGQAGLAISYRLKELRQEHLVLERARVAENWRTQRWDSLMFQFPNWSIELPGYAYTGDDPDGFAQGRHPALHPGLWLEDQRATQNGCQPCSRSGRTRRPTATWCSRTTVN